MWAVLGHDRQVVEVCHAKSRPVLGMSDLGGCDGKGAFKERLLVVRGLGLGQLLTGAASNRQFLALVYWRPGISQIPCLGLPEGTHAVVLRVGRIAGRQGAPVHTGDLQKMGGQFKSIFL